MDYSFHVIVLDFGEETCQLSIEQVDNYLMLNNLILQILITIGSRPNDLFTYHRGNITSIRKHVPEHFVARDKRTKTKFVVMKNLDPVLYVGTVLLIDLKNVRKIIGFPFSCV